MKYCSHCGEEILFSIPEGDNRPRYWCNHCGVIHYQNPKIVVGAIPVWEGRFLLCKRS
ncbi:MAG TPA: NUDIX hydrolase, partial [Alcanivorax sp.]|nr:NUDIX hydrolase [Alcanivorax sp.]